MHTLREKVVGMPASEEEHSKEVVKSFIQGSSFRSLFTSGQLFLLPCMTYPRTLPDMHVQLFSKTDSSPEAYGGFWHHLLWVVPLLFDP